MVSARGASQSARLAPSVARELAAGDVPGLLDVLEQDALQASRVFGGVPFGCLGWTVAQRFVQHAAVERGAGLELQDMRERRRDIDIADGRGVAPGGTKVGAERNQRVAQLMRADRAVVDYQARWARSSAGQTSSDVVGPGQRRDDIRRARTLDPDQL